MAMKTVKNKEFYESSEFIELISTLSLKEVMLLQFSFKNIKKWESLVACKDLQKKMYVCNICNVAQYGEKNLFSHLNGKKHFWMMENVQQLRFPKGNENKNVTKKKFVPPNKKDNKNTKSENVDIKKKALPTTKSVQPVIKSDDKPLIKPLTTESVLTKSVVTQEINKPEAKPKVVKASIVTKNVSEETNKFEANSKEVNASVITKTIVSAGPNNIEANKSEAKPKYVNVSIVRKSAASEVLVPKPTPIGEPKTIVNKSRPNTQKPTEGNEKPAAKTSNASSENKNQTNSKNSKVSKTNVTDTSIMTPNEIVQPKLETIELDEPDTVSPINSAFRSNIVLNPLSKAASNEVKISCVPLSKLISTEPKDQVQPVNNETEVIPVLLRLLSESNSARNENKKKEKKKKLNEFNENVKDIVSTRSVLQVSTVKHSVTFESSNITDVMGLLGVEYVIKIIRNMRDKDARFQCCLCDIIADEQSMHNHLIGINHRLKYCEKHFPTAISQYKQYTSYVPEEHQFKVLAPILEKLAIAIEKHHGRENAYLCYEYSFSKNSQNIIANVFNRKHASEAFGPTFTHVIDSKDVDMLIENACGQLKTVNNEAPLNSFTKRNTLYEQQNAICNYPAGLNSIEPNNVQAVDDETHKRMVDMFLRDTRETQSSRHRHSSRNVKRDRSRSRSPDRKRKRPVSIISQWNMERRSVSPLRDGDIWQAYRHLVDQSIRELNTSFEAYKLDPEEHPQYKKEWQKFWKRRKDELIAAGINHRTYNYQNEWILFFNARLEELYNQDVENIKIKCRERLCLPMTNNELPNPKYHVNFSDNEKDYDSTVNPNDQNNDKDQTQQKDNKAEDINVIHVLRLLTALEGYLGSLGPSITEMLAKALQLSKVDPNKINSTILTNENCAVLEIAKEKFTGLVISKILDSAQERAIKKAIADTELLLEYAELNGTKSAKGNESEPRPSERVEQTSTLGQSAIKLNANILHNKLDQINKSELAAKLASSLISQGKTKINQEQLKQIIQVYSQIEQKKQPKMPSSSISSANNISNRLSPTMTFHSNRN
ncbi:hypothetical protein KR222_003670, partial [Zaprionus bogoriensis]